MLFEDFQKAFEGSTGLEPRPEKGGGKFVFREDVGYRAVIRKATVVTSQYTGDQQLRLAVNLYGGEDNDEVLGEPLLHIRLPWQQSDMGQDAERVANRSRRCLEDVQRIYACAYPKQFADYKSRQPGKGRGYTYIGWDDQPMTRAVYDKRAADIKKKLVPIIDELKQFADNAEVDDLEGVQFYVVKAHNKRTPQYPYTNYYRTRPETVPMAGEEGDGVPSIHTASPGTSHVADEIPF